jgi:rhodanese-related sulfurtransferase
MPRTVKDMLAAANAAVPRLSPAEAARKIREGGMLVLDVRDPTEVWQSGKIKGALTVSRGMLEFKADPASPYHDPALAQDRTILVHCASGGRAALAGQTLQEMGFTSVYNAGGFKELAAEGLETEPLG